uniref:Clusterin associated protein 1 n=1 Tax=Eptatretus burgeri TaxID=7764 RepID=A0A8C4QPP8_EPTBU
MSFRDLRNFTEMMRVLGYPRLISIESFRQPNFPLVAEILHWFVARFEPEEDIPFDIQTDQERVLFIRTVAELMATKAHIRLNTKWLYQADGYGVKELLKLANVLCEASQESSGVDHVDDQAAHVKFDLGSQVKELKLCRRLASEITRKGAALYDLLGQEVDLREMRKDVISQPLKIGEAEKALQDTIADVQDKVEKTTALLENIASDEANLDAKIEKKKQELERSQKRLQTLRSVRPAFMDEYERAEGELENQYAEFVQTFRNLAQMEQQLSEAHQVEQEQPKETEGVLHLMQNKLRNEEKQLLMGSEDEDSEIEFDEDSAEDQQDERHEELIVSQPKRRGHHRMRAHVFGTMNGSDADDNNDGSGSASNCEIDSDGDGGKKKEGENEAPYSTMVDNDSELVMNAVRPRRARAPQQHTESDDDF